MAQANLQKLVRILPENRKHPTHRHIFGPEIFFSFWNHSRQDLLFILYRLLNFHFLSFRFLEK